MISLQSYISSLNLVNLMYLFYSVTIIMLEILLQTKSFFTLHDSISLAFEYGKLLSSRNFKKYLHIPKRWFMHFYITSLVMSIASCTLFWCINFKGMQLPSCIATLLNVLTTDKRISAVNGNIACIVLIVYSLHTWKRLYETLCINVFGDSKMSIFHYIVGVTHYIGAFVGLLSLFPGFISPDERKVEINFYSISLMESIIIVGVVLASYHQLKYFKILASLRSNSGQENKMDRRYSIPYGGFFDYISCPHMLMEILIYLGLGSLMSFKHTTWNMICLFVCCNQMEVAYRNHRWYRDYFKSYPLKRKALIPLIF